MKLIVKKYKEAVIKGNIIDIDNYEYEIYKGKHSIWIPKLEAKITWTYNGKITSFKDWDKGKDKEDLTNGTFNTKGCWDIPTLKSIINEYYFFKELEKERFSPPLAGIFYISKVFSDFMDKTCVDKVGVYGHFIKDANKLEKGMFTFDSFLDKFWDKLILSDWTKERTDKEKGIYGGALGDIKKPANTVNGYLIDVRRTIWDMLKIRR